VIQNIVFMHWLKKKGVHIFFGLAGTPGYLDYVYWRWCKNQGCSPNRILTLRALCVANVILAAIIVIPTVIMTHVK
jgi:hypothetical protein